MKTKVLIALAVLIGSNNLWAQEAETKKTFERPRWAVDLGAAVTQYNLADDDDSQSKVKQTGFGGGVALNYQGKGHSGFQLPVTYQYYKTGRGIPRGMDSIHVGLHYVFHFVKGKSSSRFDPYLSTGAGYLFAKERECGRRCVNNSVSVPVWDLGGGMRYFVSKKVGLFVEGNIHLFPYVSQVGGKFGITFGF